MALLLLVACGVGYFLFTVIFLVVPGVFGFSLGIRHLYVKILLKVFQVKTVFMVVLCLVLILY